MKIGIIQQAISPDVEANKVLLRNEIVAVAKEGAELVVLQELHNTPYFCQTENTELFNLAEPIPGPSTEFYSQVARECGVVLVIICRPNEKPCFIIRFEAFTTSFAVWPRLLSFNTLSSRLCAPSSIAVTP